MTHPEEHILELYVLNADSVAGRRGGIDDHLRGCAGCAALVKEISGYYADLDAELRKEGASAEQTVGQALTKRDSGLSVWEEKLTRSRRIEWKSPVKNARYYIRRYPIAAAGTTFAFAAIATLALLTGPRPEAVKPPTDLNPAYVTIVTVNGSFEVYNRLNQLLWRRSIPDKTVITDIERHTGSFRHAVIDMYGDGQNEVVTTLGLDGNPKPPKRGLHVFDGRGDIQTLPFERKVSFRGTPYETPVGLEGGSLVLIDSTDPQDLKLFLTVKNDRSPNAIIRMNRKGEILGEFWHHGQIAAAYLDDLDGDGRMELVLCGFNDVDDHLELSKPILAILDPAKITGVKESRMTRGYGFEASTAERYYVKLPLTELNQTMYTNAGMARMTIHDSSVVFMWSSQIMGDQVYDLDFVFSRNLVPTRVLSNTQTHQLFEREFDAKHIAHRLDAAALERLRSQVRFWDGKQWVQGPVRLAPIPPG